MLIQRLLFLTAALSSFLTDTFAATLDNDALSWQEKRSLPKILRYAALGDSYASGDGAGSSKLLPSFDATCGRFSDAYPIQLSQDPKLDHPIFQNLACGGAFTSTVAQQSTKVGEADLITVTVGGNEADFFVVLNECVYQWRPFSTCMKEIARARTLIESGDFIGKYSDMARVIRGSTTMRVALTGYARFFNDSTDQCDNVTFSKTDTKQVLSKKLRKDFNDLVLLLNEVIKAAARIHDIGYIDIDAAFEGHRFCEAGITEPYDGNNTWFFNARTGRTDSRLFPTPMPQQTLRTGPIEDFADMTRVFHPTSIGHTAIKNATIRWLTDVEQDWHYSLPYTPPGCGFNKINRVYCKELDPRSIEFRMRDECPEHDLRHCTSKAGLSTFFGNLSSWLRIFRIWTGR